MGLIPGWGTKIPHGAWHGQKDPPKQNKQTKTQKINSVSKNVAAQKEITLNLHPGPCSEAHTSEQPSPLFQAPATLLTNNQALATLQ